MSTPQNAKLEHGAGFLCSGGWSGMGLPAALPARLGHSSARNAREDSLGGPPLLGADPRHSVRGSQGSGPPGLAELGALIPHDCPLEAQVKACGGCFSQPQSAGTAKSKDSWGSQGVRPYPHLDFGQAPRLGASLWQPQG